MFESCRAHHIIALRSWRVGLNLKSAPQPSAQVSLSFRLPSSPSKLSDEACHELKRPRAGSRKLLLNQMAATRKIAMPGVEAHRLARRDTAVMPCRSKIPRPPLPRFGTTNSRPWTQSHLNSIAIIDFNFSASFDGVLFAVESALSSQGDDARPLPLKCPLTALQRLPRSCCYFLTYPAVADRLAPWRCISSDNA
jgi:hypothetical protein